MDSVRRSPGSVPDFINSRTSQVCSSLTFLQSSVRIHKRVLLFAIKDIFVFLIHYWFLSVSNFMLTIGIDGSCAKLATAVSTTEIKVDRWPLWCVVHPRDTHTWHSATQLPTSCSNNSFLSWLYSVERAPSALAVTLTYIYKYSLTPWIKHFLFTWDW